MNNDQSYLDYILNRIRRHATVTVRLDSMQYHYSRQTGHEWYTLYVPEWLKTYRAEDTLDLRLKVEADGVVIVE